MTWAISEKGYSQRRACRLVGLQPKTYRYASTRPDDSALRTSAGGWLCNDAASATVASGCYWLGKGSGSIGRSCIGSTRMSG